MATNAPIESSAAALPTRVVRAITIKNDPDNRSGLLPTDSITVVPINENNTEAPPKPTVNMVAY